MTWIDIEWFRSKVRLQLEKFNHQVLDGASSEVVANSYKVLVRTRRQLFLAIDIYLIENSINNGTNNN